MLKNAKVHNNQNANANSNNKMPFFLAITLANPFFKDNA